MLSVTSIISFSNKAKIRNFNSSNVKQNASKFANPVTLEDVTADNCIRTCPCHSPQSCPLNGPCLVFNVIYKATVEEPNHPDKFYIGSTTNFKVRYRVHLSTFSCEKYNCSLPYLHIFIFLNGIIGGFPKKGLLWPGPLITL